MKGLRVRLACLELSFLGPLGIVKVPAVFFNLKCSSWAHFKHLFPTHGTVLWGFRAIEKWGMPGGGRSLGVAFEGDACPWFLPAGSPPYEHPPHKQF